MISSILARHYDCFESFRWPMINIKSYELFNNCQTTFRTLTTVSCKSSKSQIWVGSPVAFLEWALLDRPIDDWSGRNELLYANLPVPCVNFRFINLLSPVDEYASIRSTKLALHNAYGFYKQNNRGSVGREINMT